MKHYILAAAALAFCAACEQHPTATETSSSNSTEPAIEKTPALKDKKVEPVISTPLPVVEPPVSSIPAPVEEKKPETAEPAPALDEKKSDASDAPAADPKP